MSTCLHVQDPRNIAMSRPLDFAVLKYKNQKLAEQLEVHKFEFRALESRFNDLKEKQRTHNETLILVENYWERVTRSRAGYSPCLQKWIFTFKLQYRKQQYTEGWYMLSPRSRLFKWTFRGWCQCHRKFRFFQLSTRKWRLFRRINNNWYSAEDVPSIKWSMACE